MHRLALGLILALLVACGEGVAPTTASTTPATTTPTSGTDAPAPSTTEAEPDLQFLTLSRKQISVLPDGAQLTAGLEASLEAAFDDYAGGIVFAQERAVHELWHLRSGRASPELLFSNPVDTVFAFLDLVAPTGRPPTALARSGDSLVLIPITGGAPEALALADLAEVGTGGDFSTASLGGTALMVAWSDPDTACTAVDLFTLAGQPLSVGLYRTCNPTTPVLSDEGDVVVGVESGASVAVVIRSAADGIERSRWQVSESAGRLHVSQGRIVYVDDQGVSTLTYDGSWEAVPSIGPRSTSVSLARSPVVVSDLATLGGFAALGDCSASTHASLATQSGLTEAAATTRRAIGNAAVECDIARLASLIDDSVQADPTSDWWSAEGKGFPVLLELVNLLETPFAAAVADDGTLVYVWPAVAEGVDDEAAWEALRTLYNEEDIDRWKSGADPYDRLVVRITEDGRWIQASNEF